MDNLLIEKFESFRDNIESLKNQIRPQLSKSKPTFLFGSGEFGKSLAKVLKQHQFNIQGFINSKPSAQFVDDLPVYALQDIQAEDLSAQVVISVFNRDTPLDSLMNMISSKGFQDIRMPWDVYQEFGDELGWKYWLSGKDTVCNQVDQIQKAYELMGDSLSKETLLNICRFRLGINNEYASFKHEDHQYFNVLTLDYFKDDRGCNYVDCGAYNGDTLIEASQFLKLENAYLFEPDPKNFRQLVANIKTKPIKTICFPLAVANSYQILSFESNGEGGTITHKGTEHIATAALDEIFFNSKIDFIKYDVEGAEISALEGSRQLITLNRPVLVISLYHKPCDLWELPIYLANLCKDYQFYIRQHFYNSFDSVLYAIPNEVH